MLSETIHSNPKIRYDATCKKILGMKHILAIILRGCVKEYVACADEEIYALIGEPEIGTHPMLPDTQEGDTRIRGMQTEDATVYEGTITYDIRFMAKTPGPSGKTMELIINIEAQNNFYPGYPLVKRAVYYGSRLISSQYGTEFTRSHYEDIKKVYSIWICLNPPESRKNGITQYALQETCLEGNAVDQERNYNIMNVIMVYVGEEKTENSQVLNVLSSLFSNDLTATEKINNLVSYGVPIGNDLTEEVTEMCNLSEAIEQRGIQKGIQEGIQKGIQKGEEKGRKLGHEEGHVDGIHTAVKLLYQSGMEDTEIAVRLRMSVDEVRSVLHLDSNS